MWYISVDVFTLDIETWKLILYVFIQIQSPVHQLTSILDFLVTIYSFLVFGGAGGGRGWRLSLQSVVCQIFMGLVQNFNKNICFGCSETAPTVARFLEFNILTCLGYAAL